MADKAEGANRTNRERRERQRNEATIFVNGCDVFLINAPQAHIMSEGRITREAYITFRGSGTHRSAAKPPQGPAVGIIYFRADARKRYAALRRDILLMQCDIPPYGGVICPSDERTGCAAILKSSAAGAPYKANS